MGHAGGHRLLRWYYYRRGEKKAIEDAKRENLKKQRVDIVCCFYKWEKIIFFYFRFSDLKAFINHLREISACTCTVVILLLLSVHFSPCKKHFKQFPQYWYQNRFYAIFQPHWKWFFKPFHNFVDFWNLRNLLIKMFSELRTFMLVILVFMHFAF